jgi:SAM-dependent methyltransferase
MLDFTHRSCEKELLDGVSIPYDDVILNMQELNTINTLLGGHAITLKGFKQLIGDKKEISIVEIGCGGGDNIRVLETYCIQNNIKYQLWGIDINFDITTFAYAQNKNLNIVCSDYRKVVFEQKPDIIFSSLFCHHFSDDELVDQLRWMKENAKVGFFINDLHRHKLAYYSIKMLTKLCSKSYLVKNDAPLSVARGFTKSEWRVLFKNAGIEPYFIQWKWAFRHLIIFAHER